MKASLLSLALALAAVPAFAQPSPTLPEGTEIRVRTDQKIPAKPPLGAAYSATVSEDVLDHSGVVAIPRASPARLAAVKGEGGKDVALDLRSVTVKGRLRVSAAEGVRSAVLAAGYLALIQGTFLNGVPIVVCPPVVFLGLPPVCPLSPWQDFAHMGSLVFGTLGFLALRAHPVAREWQSAPKEN